MKAPEVTEHSGVEEHAEPVEAVLEGRARG
jgi:hypothetical protein